MDGDSHIISSLSEALGEPLTQRVSASAFETEIELTWMLPTSKWQISNVSQAVLDVVLSWKLESLTYKLNLTYSAKVIEVEWSITLPKLNQRLPINV